MDQAIASATESLNILVGLTLKLVHCITAFKLVGNTGLWFVLLKLVAWKDCCFSSVWSKYLC